MAKKLKDYYDYEYLKFLSDLIAGQYDKFDTGLLTLITKILLPSFIKS